MSDEERELFERAVQALRKELGIVGTARFLQLLSPGKGNWAEERHAWQDSLEPGQFAREIKAARAAAPKPAKPKPARRPRAKAKA